MPPIRSASCSIWTKISSSSPASAAGAGVPPEAEDGAAVPALEVPQLDHRVPEATRRGEVLQAAELVVADLLPLDDEPLPHRVGLGVGGPVVGFRLGVGGLDLGHRQPTGLDLTADAAAGGPDQDEGGQHRQEEDRGATAGVPSPAGPGVVTRHGVPSAARPDP